MSLKIVPPACLSGTEGETLARGAERLATDALRAIERWTARRIQQLEDNLQQRIHLAAGWRESFERQRDHADEQKQRIVLLEQQLRIQMANIHTLIEAIDPVSRPGKESDESDER